MPDASIADEMRYGVIAQSAGSRPRRQPRLASSRGGVMMLSLASLAASTEISLRQLVEPLLETLLTNARPTGYDAFGHTLPKKERKGDAHSHTD